MDKFLYRVDSGEETLEAYARDPERFVARWAEAETTSGHRFSDEERRALAERDYVALYRMGANPFLLWTLMLPILQRETPDAMAVARIYREKIKPFGRPDCRT